MSQISAMKNENPVVPSVRVIEPATGWKAANFRELKEYSDLFFFLVWRNIKVLYAQTVLGFLWAIVQPLIQIAIFTIIFGKIAKVSTDGIPYVLFSSVAVIAWSYMSQSMTASSGSLVKEQNLLGKVYIPRLIFPVIPILAKLVDFTISLLVLVPFFLYFHVAPTSNMLLLPVFILLMMMLALGVGLWLSAMAIRFRDVNHAMPFVIRMLMYSAPIVYASSSIPDRYRLFYALNPIVSVIEGFRSSLLGTPFAWDFIVPGMITCSIIFVSGLFYFQKMERVFVDVI